MFWPDLCLALLAFPAQDLAAILRAIEAQSPRLSPRPVAVAGVERPLLDLGGTWKFNPRAPDGLAQALPSESAGWKDIVVPGEWAMQGFTVEPGKAAAYWREFVLPADWNGKTARLRFDTVHSACEVWVNGSPVGTNESCFTPFELDVTRALKPGRNTLALSVTSESRSDVLDSATQYAAHPLGGITRKVQLFALPAAHLAEEIVEADFDAVTGTGTLTARLSLEGRATLRLGLLDREGQHELARLELEDAMGDVQPRMVLPDIGSWDPEHPRLYTLRAELIDGERVLERVEQRVGFRRVEIRGNRMLVNGQPVKLEGACRHEVHPTRGRSLTPELCRQDAELFLRANCNYVRTSHYPPSEEFLEDCDELGLFVECEAALCWVMHDANAVWKDASHLDPRLFPYLMRANLANLAANRNHPSVVVWSLANESRWSPLFDEVNRRVKAADPTRPTSFHDQCWGDYNNAGSKADIAVYHYPGENGPAACDAEKRPVLFGEYCHVECYNRRELAADPGVRDDWGRGFARMVDLMWQHQGCLGGAIWAGIDDVFCLPDGRRVGYGMWGSICDGWRRDKPETFHVRKAYSPVRVDLRSARVAEGVLHVGIENRYDFSDLRELRIEWTSGERSGPVALALAPHARGELVLKLPEPAPAALTLRFTDPRGFVCEEERIELGPASSAAHGRPAADAAWKVANGKIESGRIGSRTVVLGGPALMLLPLSNEECAPVDLGQWVPLNGVADESVAVGAFELEPQGSALRVRYSFTVQADLDPRQWGAVLYLPRAFDRLSWRRDAQWSLYPADHIGRPQGSARALVAASAAAYPERAPQGPWSSEPTALGGNDFASTKAAVREALLTDAEGYGLRLTSDGTRAVRAFVDGERVGLLVTGFHTGGGDGFFATHFATERRPIHKGERIEGEFVVELVGP